LVVRKILGGLPESVADLAVKAARAEKEYKDAFEAAMPHAQFDIKSFDSTKLGVMGEDTFWKAVDLLWELVAERIKRSDRIESAVDEFFRLAAVEQTPWTLGELIYFPSRWEYQEAVHTKPLDKIYDEGSDDGFSDVCDASPLAGMAISLKLRKGEFQTFAAYKKAVFDEHGQPIAGLI
jgi:hypothetical protein